MMTFDSIPEDKRLFEITQFARYSLYDMEPVRVNLATLPTNTPVLGDYRTIREVFPDDATKEIHSGGKNVMLRF